MTTPTDTGHIGDTTYSLADAEEYRRQRALDNPHHESTAVINSGNLGEISMLLPVMDAIAERHGKRLVMGSFGPIAVNPDWLLETAGIVDDEDAILIAHRAVIAPKGRNILDEEVESLNQCIRQCKPQTQSPDEPCPYPNWYLDGTSCAIGNVAYRIITLPFFWHNSSTSQGRLDQFRRSFEAALMLATDRSLHAATIDAAANRTRDAIAEHLAARSSENIRELREEVPELVRRAAAYEQSVVEVNRRLDEVRIQLEALDAVALDEDQLKDKVEIELRELDNNQHVVTTGIRNGEIVVHTSELTMTTPDGDSAKAGEFQINLNFEDHELKVNNLTRRLGAYDHPHVSEGQFCTGDQRRIIDQLMSRTEIAATVAVIIDLLQTVNPDDTYTSEWRAWFDMTE